MKKVAWLCLLLALALLLTGCAKDESKELEKSAVRVGNVVYTYGDLLDVEASTRSYYEQMAQLYAMYGMEAQMPTDAQLREEALNTLLWQAVVLDKADQMKLSTLTGAEQAEVSARTDAAMADYRAQALELLALPEDTAEADKSAAVDAFLAEILRRLENGEEWARVREHYNDDTSLLYGSPVVCQGFPYAPEGYVAKAMELAASGASDAVYVEGYGCFVIRYMADVPQGPVAQDAVREHIMEELLTSKQQQSFSSTVNIWSDAAASRMIINYNLLGQ